MPAQISRFMKRKRGKKKGKGEKRKTREKRRNGERERREKICKGDGRGGGETRRIM